MTRDEALAKMQEIDNMRAVLTEAHSRLNLIAAGVIESPEEITLQSTKVQAAIDKVDVGVIKGIEKETKDAEREKEDTAAVETVATKGSERDAGQHNAEPGAR